MKTYDRKKDYKRDRPQRNGQYIFPWSDGLTISVNEAARRLGKGYNTTLLMCHDGTIQSWPLRDGVKGSPLRVSKDSVDLYNERQLAKHALDDKELERRIEKRMSGLSQALKASSSSHPAEIAS